VIPTDFTLALILYESKHRRIGPVNQLKPWKLVLPFPLSIEVYLMNVLSPRRSSLNANDNEKAGTTLMNLPPEILQLMTEYLSPADTATLTLCNHSLLRALGNIHWSSLRHGNNNHEYRELFLITLTRDLPGHFFCHHCARLHKCAEFGPPGPAWQPETRLSCVEKQCGEERWRCVEHIRHCYLGIDLLSPICKWL
jgi:hypothetical protein